jgi:hypothetical protein
MCDQKDDREVISTIIYTTEAEASAKKAEEEKKVEDPSPERAIALLKGDVVTGGEAHEPSTD